MKYHDAWQELKLQLQADRYMSVIAESACGVENKYKKSLRARTVTLEQVLELMEQLEWEYE